MCLLAYLFHVVRIVGVVVVNIPDIVGLDGGLTQLIVSPTL